MKKWFSLIAAVLLFFPGHAQELLPDKIAAKLPVYSQAFPFEKVYLQTDRELYLAGETIWFNARQFTRKSTPPAQLSTEITVNLYHADGTFISSDKFLSEGGEAAGDLQLSADLPAGRYYLAAFTPLQQKVEEIFIKPIVVEQFYAGAIDLTFPGAEEVFPAGQDVLLTLKASGPDGKPAGKHRLNFTVLLGDKPIAGGKIRTENGTSHIPVKIPEKTGRETLALQVTPPGNHWTKKWLLKTSADQLRLEFRPEGGTLLAHIPQKIGYAVTAPGKRPVDIQADIIDSYGNLVAKTNTFTPGFGLFPFRTDPGKSYRLIITSEYGKGQGFSLPQPGAAKLALSVPQTDSDFIYADLFLPDSVSQQLVLVVTSGFSFEWGATLEVAASARIKIPKRELPTGILQLTVFDPAGKPLASRLLYRPPTQTLSFAITSEVQDNEKVQITVAATNENGKPATPKATLSVIDPFWQLPAGEELPGYLLLNSELERPVPNASGLTDPKAGLETALDYLLIASRLKNFSWGKVLGLQPGQTETAAVETGISGRVTDNKGKAVPNAKISILNSRNMQMYNASADAQGRFAFPSLEAADLSAFNITATDERGKKACTVTLNTTFSDQIGQKIREADNRFATPAVSPEKRQAYLAAHPEKIKPKPTVKTAPAPAQVKSDSYKNLLATATSLLEVIRMMKPYNLMNGQIVFYGTINSINFQSGALIVIDGQKMGTQADILNALSPFDVDRINISLDPMDIQKYTGFNNVGVIEITTKKGQTAKNPENPAATPEIIYQNGYRRPRNFPSPEAIPDAGNPPATLFWNHHLHFEKDGTATFTLPLPKRKTDFVIRAEGADAEGRTGKATHTFSVK